MKTIQIITLDLAGFETRNQEFDTIKEAKAWVKECGLKAAFWMRSFESDMDSVRQNVLTIQLTVDGDIRRDWFPDWVDAHEIAFATSQISD